MDNVERFVPAPPAAVGAGARPPLTLPPPGPPPVPVAVRAPAAILDELVGEIGEVSAALLASVDGFSIARSSSMPDEPAYAAMLAAAVGLAHQLAAMGGGATLRQLVVEHDAGLIVVWPIGGQRVLAVLTASDVDQRRLRAFVQSHASALSGTRAGAPA